MMASRKNLFDGENCKNEYIMVQYKRSFML